MAATATTPARAGEQAATRALVERLAALERTPCSPGERQAAEALAGELRAAGLADVALEDAASWGTFHPQVTALGALGVIAALLAAAGRRRGAAVCALAAATGIADEAQNGPRVLRRLVRRRRTTVNVIARAGDAVAERTLVVLAHHDAPQTGRFYDQRLAIAVHARWPALLARARRQPPQWWLGLAAPLSALVAIAARRRAPALLGAAIGAAGTAAVADMWRGATVAGANDNLSGVAVLASLASRVAQAPPAGLRVLLVSCGAEETLQDGVRGFLAAHRHELAPGATWFLNLDAVGSPHLIMVEGEGPIWMERYTDPSFRDLVADAATACGIDLERGLLARASSDTIIPSRAGHASVLIASLTDWRMPANYHLPSDVPENLDYESVADATDLAHEVLTRLALTPRRPR